jgi:hypothetical protein
VKNVLLYTLFFISGYCTSGYFYSKYVDPNNLSAFSKESFRLGCLITLKNYKIFNKQSKDFCEEKSQQHKNSLDNFFKFVLKYPSEK